MAKRIIMTKDEKIQVNISGECLKTSSSFSIEEMHLNASKYLEEKIDQLDEEKLKEIIKVDRFIDQAYKSGDILIGLQEAIDNLAQESELKEIKLLHFLEEFYHRLPITKFYTAEIREENFKTAVLYSADLLNETELLSGVYHDYFESDEIYKLTQNVLITKNKNYTNNKFYLK